MLQIEVIRELTLEDLAAPQTRPALAPKSSIDRILGFHHAQARMIAEGKTLGQIAAVLGTSVNRLNTLLVDPAFEELVEYYRSQLEDVYLNTHMKASQVARLAMDRLMERLEVDSEKISTNQLREIAQGMLDRTDLPPKAANAQINAVPVITFNFGGLKGQLQEKPQVTIEHEEG